MFVRCVHIETINDLKQRTAETISSVTFYVLGRVYGEMEYRLDTCKATNGARIELH